MCCSDLPRALPLRCPVGEHTERGCDVGIGGHSAQLTRWTRVGLTRGARSKEGKKKSGFTLTMCMLIMLGLRADDSYTNESHL